MSSERRLSVLDGGQIKGVTFEMECTISSWHSCGTFHWLATSSIQNSGAVPICHCARHSRNQAVVMKLNRLLTINRLVVHLA